MKKKLLSILTFALILSALSLTGCSNDAKVDKLLADTVSGVNKQCPMTIDKETRLDNAAALPGKIIQYNYTLINYSKSQLTADQIASIKSTMNASLRNTIKSSSDMKPLKDYGVTFKYVYKSNDGTELISLTITPSDYQ